MSADTSFGPRDSLSFLHQTAPYASDDEFLGTIVPIVQEGVARGDSVFIATDHAKLHRLRDALGDMLDEVDLETPENFYDLPAQSLAKTFRYLKERETTGTRCLRICELPWIGLADASIREWKRYEAFLNLAFASSRVHFVCLCDIRSLPVSIVADALRTHPEVLEGSQVRTSPDFGDPAAFIWENDPPLPEPTGPVTALAFSGDLHTVRDFVWQQARNAGMKSGQTAELVLAVNELATNILLHGGGQGTIQVWREPDALMAALIDQGPGFRDPFLGHLRPESNQEHGWGLWLARQLCDQVEIRSGPVGSVVRVRVLIDRPDQP